MNREFSTVAEPESAELSASRGNPSERAAAAIEILKSKPNARVKFRSGELVEVVEEHATRVEETEFRTEASRRQKTKQNAETLRATDDAGRRRRLEQQREIIEAPHADAFRTFLLYGKEGLTPEQRAQSVGTDSAGGYLAPARFASKVFTAMKAQDRLQDEDVVSVVTTEPGTSFSIPMLDDTSSSSAIVAENVGSALTPDLTFDQLVLAKASTFRTSMVKVPTELFQDSAFDLDSLVANAFASRLRRGIGASFVTTLAAGATLGVTAAASSLTPANLWDLFAAIDPEYLASPKCAWLMRLSTYIAISKLVDTAGSPIFPITRNPNGEFELLTKPVYFCPSVAAIGTSNKSVFFGALDYFVVRRVAGSLRVNRYFETYAEFGQLGFNAFLRTNAGLAKPATADSPIKFLQHS